MYIVRVYNKDELLWANTPLAQSAGEAVFKTLNDLPANTVFDKITVTREV